jgi:hypothetical protein
MGPALRMTTRQCKSTRRCTYRYPWQRSRHSDNKSRQNKHSAVAYWKTPYCRNRNQRNTPPVWPMSILEGSRSQRHTDPIRPTDPSCCNSNPVCMSWRWHCQPDRMCHWYTNAAWQQTSRSDKSSRHCTARCQWHSSCKRTRSHGETMQSKRGDSKFENESKDQQTRARKKHSGEVRAYELAGHQ